MKPLPQIKKELKRMLSLGIDAVLKKMEEYLPSNSPKYNEFIALERRYYDNQRLLLRDTAENKEIRQEFNRITTALLTFIDELEESDFQAANGEWSRRSGFFVSRQRRFFLRKGDLYFQQKQLIFIKK